jgi:hypothetical protein
LCNCCYIFVKFLINIQTQGELARGATKDYPGIIGGAIKIVKDEGIRGLYKGYFSSLFFFSFFFFFFFFLVACSNFALLFVLYCRLPISAIRELTFSSTRMGLYEPIRHALTTSESVFDKKKNYELFYIIRYLFLNIVTDPTLATKVLAGLLSGATAAAMFNPTDIIKICSKLQKD